MPGAVGAHPAMMKAEEVHALASLLEVHDPGLGRLELKAQLRQDRRAPESRLGLLGVFCTSPADHPRNEPESMSARLPMPVEPVQVDVAQARAKLRRLAGFPYLRRDRPVLHHPCAQHRAQQFQHMAVADPLLDRRHQPRVRNRLETVRDVRLRNPPPASQDSSMRTWSASCCRASGPEPERALQQVGLLR